MKRYLIVICSIFIVSCTSRTTQDLQKIIGRPLEIPAALTAHIQKRDTVLAVDNKTPKLLVYYNFQGCSSCSAAPGTPAKGSVASECTRRF